MTDYRKEAERLLDEFYLHVSATVASALADEWAEVQAAQTRSVHTRAALLAHIQRGAVPGPEQIAKWAAGWRCIDENDGLTGEASMLDRIAHAVHGGMLAAPAPDQFRDAAKMMAVQPCVETFDVDFLARLGAEVPTPAEVPMPKPVAFGVLNTAPTGSPHRLMMVRIDIPSDDQYGGALWMPLVFAEGAQHYGDAREAAGYARGMEQAAVIAWMHYMDKCRVMNTPAAAMESWCAAGAIRAAQKGGA